MDRGRESQQALVDAFRALRTRVENARLRTTACIADAIAVSERLRHDSASRTGQRYEPTEVPPLADEMQKAFFARRPVSGSNFEALKRRIDRIRAQRLAIAALQRRIRKVFGK